MVKHLLFSFFFFAFFVLGKAQGNVDSYIPVQQKEDPNVFVVIIANEHYQYEQYVPFGNHDGQTFKLYCEKALGIPSKNIRCIEDATLNQMRMQLRWLKQIMTAFEGDARAIVYYSGHGMPDEEGKSTYLLPVDGNSNMPESGLSSVELYSMLAEIPSAATLVLLDACFSGARRDGQMFSLSRGVAIKPRQVTVSGNVVVFSAAQGNETAYPYTEKRHGLFTYYILEQLQKSGGRISLGDMADYVTKMVGRTSLIENEKSQTPSIIASSKVPNWRNWQFAYTTAGNYIDVGHVPQENEVEGISNNDINLADGKKEELLKARAKEKVGQFCNHISFIANKDKSLKTRLYYVDKAKDLFLNRGKALYDDNGFMERDSVIMQVTSIRQKQPRNVYLNKYLPNLAQLKYPQVEITSTNVAEMKVSHLQIVREGLYTCTVYFYQYFIGKTKDNKVIYKDKTNKRVQCYIKEEGTEDGKEYVVFLGDIYAETTETF